MAPRQVQTEARGQDREGPAESSDGPCQTRLPNINKLRKIKSFTLRLCVVVIMSVLVSLLWRMSWYYD